MLINIKTARTKLHCQQLQACLLSEHCS